MTQDTNLIIPSLYIKRVGEQAVKLALTLTKARTKFVLRITGGCGYMSPADAQGLYDLFCSAFSGYQGALLFGGTRMVDRKNPACILPSITEIAPALIKKDPKIIVLGVVPKTNDLTLHPEYGLVISDEDDNPYITIVHPDQDVCLIVQKSADEEVIWEAEYEECIRIIRDLRQYAGFESLLVSYNGGKVTEKEIRATAALGWPVLLIAGSGRKTDELAQDQNFLSQHPNVIVAPKNSAEIRKVLAACGALPQDSQCA